MFFFCKIRAVCRVLNIYMAKRMNLKGRPGVLFVILLVVCFVILYFSWKSMITQKEVPRIKDGYSSQQRAYEMHQERNSYKRKGYSPVKQDQQWHRNGVQNVGKTNDWARIPPLKADETDFSSNLAKYRKKGFPVKARQMKLTTTAQDMMFEQEKTPYYKKIDQFIGNVLERMERFVHLDLKGAAPKVSYFKELFPLLRKMGATGLLIEYEDTFPYSGPIKGLAAKNAYSSADIQQILKLAKDSGLKIMPLIQTFGHMEFVLKYVDKLELRESGHTPQVIKSNSNSTYILIAEIIKQVLNAHPEATSLHIGCDEVYELGRGASLELIKKEKVTVEQLFLRHVKQVAELVRNYNKNNGRLVKPIMWDDELRKIPEQQLKDSSIPRLVDIMIWNYTPNIFKKVDNVVWKKYARLFKRVWIASSFKGATGPRQFYTAPDYHISNHFSWLKAISKYGQDVNFVGVALTGWQRFDHFATLCELIPAAIPSLAVCLATMKYGGFDKQVHKTTSEILRCSNLIEMTVPVPDPKTFHVGVSQDCRFPGSDFYYALQEFYGYTKMDEKLSHKLNGWLSDYQIAHGFSSPGLLTYLKKDINTQNSNFRVIKNPLKENLLNIYSNDTVVEWLEENIFERIRHNDGYLAKIEKLMAKSSWKSRPFDPINVDKAILGSQRQKMESSVNTDASNIAVGARTGGKRKGMITQSVNREISKENTLPVNLPLLNQNTKKRISDRFNSLPNQTRLANRIQTALKPNVLNSGLDTSNKLSQNTNPKGNSLVRRVPFPVNERKDIGINTSQKSKPKERAYTPDTVDKSTFDLKDNDVNGGSVKNTVLQASQNGLKGNRGGNEKELNEVGQSIKLPSFPERQNKARQNVRKGEELVKTKDDFDFMKKKLNLRKENSNLQQKSRYGEDWLHSRVQGNNNVDRRIKSNDKPNVEREQSYNNDIFNTRFGSKNNLLQRKGPIEGKAPSLLDAFKKDRKGLSERFNEKYDFEDDKMDSYESKLLKQI